MDIIYHFGIILIVHSSFHFSFSCPRPIVLCLIKFITSDLTCGISFTGCEGAAVPPQAEQGIVGCWLQAIPGPSWRERSIENEISLPVAWFQCQRQAGNCAVASSACIADENLWGHTKDERLQSSGQNHSSTWLLASATGRSVSESCWLISRSSGANSLVYLLICLNWNQMLSCENWYKQITHTRAE